MQIQQNPFTKYCVIAQSKEGKNTYGIQMICSKTGEILFEQKDICTDHSALTHLIRRLEENDVRIIHLPDIIEDFLDEYYG